jgi:Tol biopolymer transport system component
VRALAFVGAVVALALAVGRASAGSYAPPPGDGFPVWAPDGQRFAFLTGRGGAALVVRSLARSDERRVADVAGVGPYPDPTSVALSPDWQWIATTRSTNGSLRLLVVRMDGSAERDLAPVSYGATPAWSPDSKRLAFRLFDGRLAVTSLDGVAPDPIARGGTALDWSPDGRRLAYAGGSPTDLDVHVVDVDGNRDVVLASGPGAQLEPSWSPDGTRIALLAQAASGEPFALAVARADGEGLRTYPGPGVSNGGSFTWTPDGQALVFARGATQGLFRLDLATGDVRRLTELGETPSVSPDGTRIAFAAVGECRDRSGIYVAQADGSRARRLTNDCRIYGTARGDVIVGTPLADVLVGLGGDDRLVARDPGYAGETLLGGDGDDVLLGAVRGDILRGGRGGDRLRGGNSQDVLEGGPGRDFIEGQRGLDLIHARDGTRDTVVCGTNVRRHTLERDEVWVDRLDRVASDCEVVHLR